MRIILMLCALLGLPLVQDAYSADETTAAETTAAVHIGDVDHIGLAVQNLPLTQRFFTEQLGFKLVGEDPSYPAAFVRNEHVLITLWQVADPANAVAFDRRKNIGLHHLAMRVDDFAALDKLYAKLKDVAGVTIEFAPELLGGGPAKHMMIYEPGGIRLEFIHRPAPAAAK